MPKSQVAEKIILSGFCDCQNLQGLQKDFNDTGAVMPQSKSDLYKQVVNEVRAVMDTERDKIANAANVSAVLWMRLPELNWAGFYFACETGLVVGPFQGKPACTRIEIGKGVCGTSAADRETLIVPNVHEFPGHIACDAASNSEIVIPLIKDDRVVGVLDIDSPVLDRFDAEDQAGLELVAKAFLELTEL